MSYFGRLAYFFKHREMLLQLQLIIFIIIAPYFFECNFSFLPLYLCPYNLRWFTSILMHRVICWLLLCLFYLLILFKHAQMNFLKFTQLFSAAIVISVNDSYAEKKHLICMSLAQSKPQSKIIIRVVWRLQRVNGTGRECGLKLINESNLSNMSKVQKSIFIDSKK